MRFPRALNRRYSVVLMICVVLIFMGISGQLLFQWYLARLDASYPPFLPAPTAGPSPQQTFLVPPTPDAETKTHVFVTDFQMIYKMSALPEAAKTFLTSPMADPGEPWQVGCDVGDGSLPRQRLIFSGVSRDFAFIHYEFGGIGHGYRVKVYRVLPSGWEPYWDEFLPHAAKDMNELRKLVVMPDNTCCISSKAKPAL